MATVASDVIGWPCASINAVLVAFVALGASLIFLFWASLNAEGSVLDVCTTSAVAWAGSCACVETLLMTGLANSWTVFINSANDK